MSDENPKPDNPSQILNDDLYQLRMELEARLVMGGSAADSTTAQAPTGIKQELRTLSMHLSYALGQMTLKNDQSRA